MCFTFNCLFIYLNMKPLSEVAPRHFVIQIQIQAVCHATDFVHQKPLIRHLNHCTQLYKPTTPLGPSNLSLLLHIANQNVPERSNYQHIDKVRLKCLK